MAIVFERQRKATRMNLESSNTSKETAVLILGMGASGMAAARLLVENGSSVILYDDRQPTDLAVSLNEAERLGIECFFHEVPDFDRIERVVISPGFPPNREPVPTLIKKGISIVSEIELASSFSHGTVIGVTGTNGKSTVVCMAEHFLQASGVAARAAGNLGNPWCDMVGRPNSASFISVLELSSFQLEAVDDFHAEYAALINIAPDHMDRYNDINEYTEAKWALCHRQTEQDCLVVPPELVQAARHRTQAQVLCVDVYDHGLPGAFLSHHREVILRDMNGGERAFACPQLGEMVHFEITNALFALILAERAGANVEAALASLGGFTSLPHRLEFVRETSGVRYYNDSKATNVHAASNALKNLPTPLIWIAGGSDKGESFLPLSQTSDRTRAAILYGATKHAIAEAIEKTTEVILVETLEEAVDKAAEMASPGDSVLLSPACASFDQFKNFAVRGNTFKKLVHQLT
jgi:UDP-N-acetylmuramoylalanine--D-glutamate ligase